VAVNPGETESHENLMPLIKKNNGFHAKPGERGDGALFFDNTAATCSAHRCGLARRTQKARRLGPRRLSQDKPSQHQTKG